MEQEQESDVADELWDVFVWVIYKSYYDDELCRYGNYSMSLLLTVCIYIIIYVSFFG